MMNDIYLEYILKKKKTGGQKAIIAVIIFAAIIVSLALLLLIFATATALSGTQFGSFSFSIGLVLIAFAWYGAYLLMSMQNIEYEYILTNSEIDIDKISEMQKEMLGITENEKSYISVFSQYVDAYQNIKCYTKQGLDASSYLVSVYVEVKFKDVDTVAPGLDFFYVRTNEDGSVYIDNLYSQYNLKIKENALDTSIQNLISEYEDSEDVNTLQKEVQGKYDTAIASDDKLSEMISTTIPNAITEWAGTIVSQNTETESTEQAPEETTESEQTETPEENTEQPAEDTPTQSEPDTVYAVDTVNVRAAADTESDKIGTLEKGTALTRTGTDGEWSVVNYNGQTGYIKTEYLTTKNSDSDSDNGGNEEQTTTSNFIAEGTVITLSDSINIRSGMSENDSKIGTAFSGEKVTVVMSYAEGWTKVTWNGQTGYIKTSLLQ